jgi:hypothetical protein
VRASPAAPPAPTDVAAAPRAAAAEASAAATAAGERDVRVPGAAVAPPAAAPAHLVVRNDVWCTIWIDGVDRGNRRNEPLEVAPGHHTVRCVNPAGDWTQEVEVAAGATRVLTGALLRELAVTLAIDAAIDGKPYARGSVARLKPGHVEVVAGDNKVFITFRESCTLRAVPELGCYR